ncbi:MAG: DUF4126 domain-containing protein [Deltaproteobacteria bacterium]|nr:MAG: DUF4126 domain-containing protein [Deltaproteobacteria bacterium]
MTKVDVLETLSLALGTAWTSSINLYATVAALGIAGRMEMIQLPPDLQVLQDPLVIGLACLMYVIEFFADKVPYIDSAWDLLHTFIRVPAGAILASRSIGTVNPALELAALLAGGGVALAAHGTKATLRLAINVSPEPFSNWLASIGEDLTVLGSIWLIFNHPLIMLILVGGFIALAAWLIPKLFRLAKNGFQMLRARLRRKEPTEPVAKPS